MPELPEVQTVMQGLTVAIDNCVLSEILVNRRDLRRLIPDDFENRLNGRAIEGLSRRGKYIIMHIEQEHPVILHLGMSGRVRIYASQDQYDPIKHDHVIFTTDKGSRIVFHDPRRFGMLYISDQKNWQDDIPFSEMGPEPLEDWRAEDLFQKLNHKKVPIKNALLDQAVVAGLGNIYVCEALFDAKINPARRSSSLSLKECAAVIDAVRPVLERAIQAGGSTLRDYRHVDGSLGYFQHSFAVYDREGQLCSNPECEDKIKRIIQAGRSSFYCPSCQNADNIKA